MTFPKYKKYTSKRVTTLNEDRGLCRSEFELEILKIRDSFLNGDQTLVRFLLFGQKAEVWLIA